MRLGNTKENEGVHFFCIALDFHYICKTKKGHHSMTKYQIFRFACVALLWLALCVILLARVERVDFMVLFAIVASGIVVFVPLYKKYVRNRKQ